MTIASHRICLHMSSGAHPHYARNTGSGEALATSTKLLAAEQTIYHDPEHPSGIVFTVTGPRQAQTSQHHQHQEVR
jgi:uncharacterized protein